VTALFFVKLFVGVVYNAFRRARMEQDGSAFLTVNQSAWLDIQRRALTQRSGHFNKGPLDPEVRSTCSAMRYTVVMPLPVVVLCWITFRGLPRTKHC